MNIGIEASYQSFIGNCYGLVTRAEWIHNTILTRAIVTDISDFSNAICTSSLCSTLASSSACNPVTIILVNATYYN